ncbi:MAG TPA: T9SS type A sorting domain-containing protein [Flavobacteriales bacterium]|nr:T9SS type A sorting domain-containing protein [Flavobacteriales bacterium]
MNKHLLFVFLTLLLYVSNADCLKAQLYTNPLGSNGQISKASTFHISEQKSNRSLTDTLELPFIDDFSYEGFAPLNTLWTDYSVFINRTMTTNPPSIGVATFDGLNAKGEPYATSNVKGSADTLTSQAINLNYSPADSIYLSFFYQPKGIGNFPEYIDTFLLEFKNPNDTVWTWMWSSKGEDYPQTERDFEQVMIPIKDTAFLKNGFQFRFRNYAQLNGSWDHWHLDYVRLDRNRTKNDTTFLDYSYMNPPTSLLKTYESVPLKHFLPNADANMDTLFQISWTTQSPASDFKLYTYHFLNHDFDPDFDRDSLLAMQGPILFRQEYLFTKAVKYTYEDPGTDWTVFDLVHYMDENTGDLIPRNDTAIYHQILSNYYSLDDGTAEERISINNNGGGFACQKFDTYLGDTLKSIQFYFNRVNDQVIDKSFYLMVWAAGSNEPGEILVNEGVHYPEYNGLNQFHTYELTTPIYLPAGSYYIGWAQNTGFDLNVGFDRNIDNNDRIFYNLDGNWYNYFSQSGTMLIRPLFGESQDIYVSTPDVRLPKTNWKLYPNPSSSSIQIEFSSPIAEPVNLVLIDITGRVVLNQTLNTTNNSVQLNDLKAGIYLAELNTKQGRLGSVQRLLVNTVR